jgi:hypothetical protein
MQYSNSWNIGNLNVIISKDLRADLKRQFLSKIDGSYFLLRIKGHIAEIFLVRDIDSTYYCHDLSYSH